MRLWDLHRYESARSSGSTALTYHINAQHILDDQGYWLDYRWVWEKGRRALVCLFLLSSVQNSTVQTMDRQGRRA